MYFIVFGAMIKIFEVFKNHIIHLSNAYGSIDGHQSFCSDKGGGWVGHFQCEHCSDWRKSYRRKNGTWLLFPTQDFEL